jgi:hypothetical protein
MRLHREDVHAVEQPVQLSTRDFEDFVSAIARPWKSIGIELLLPEYESVSLPQKQLDVISSAIAESKEVRGKRVELQLFLNQHG